MCVVDVYLHTLCTGVKHDMEKLEDQLTQVNNPIVAIPPPLKRRKVGKENCYRGQKTASAKSGFTIPIQLWNACSNEVH